MLQTFRDLFADRYRIERELGRGGMATVYLAHDLKHERPVALKVLAPELARAASAGRFLREIRIAAGLVHPQIVPVHDSGALRDGDTGAEVLYYVMPFLEGESLRDRLRRENRLTVAEAARITQAVASALDYAHRRGVLHRDIKPENILLHEGTALVADFGVARALFAAADPGSVSEAGIAIGTPWYMSPEQASGDETDARSDIYSLACVAYEMLAGQPPFAGTGARATMARHVTEPAPPLGALRPDAPPALAAVLARALAKDPADRFATAADFARALDAAAGPAAPGVPGPRRPARRAIAVLPFVNLTPGHEAEYLSDGMTDELIDALAKVEGLRVASRTSAFAFKGRPMDVRTVGTVLDVAAVLEGTVRVAGDRLRVAARLTDAADGRHLWSQRYDRHLRDVFEVQDEIAQSIVRTLRGTLLGDVGDPTPRRYTANLTAYNLYLKGRYCWNLRTREALAEAIRHFEAAIAADPAYAPAYTGLADCYALQLDYRGAPVAEGMSRAKALAMQALELDDSLAEAHTSLGWVSFIYDWDWVAAERRFRRAIELNPTYATARQWYSWLLIALVRTDEALAEGRLAVELDPTSVSIRRSLGWLLYYARQHEAAAEQLRRALAMNPTAEESQRVLALILMQQGRYDEARAAFREAIATSTETAYASAGLAALAARTGRPDEARTLLEGLRAEARERYVSPVAFVIAHAALGERDEAFGWLERAHSERRGWLAYLRVEPLLDPLRGDPRLDALIARMGLAGPAR